MSLDGVRDELEQLAAEAVQLGLSVARGMSQPSGADRARDIDARLDELVPVLEQIPEPERQALVEVWNDARLDVGYVLADGNAPSSLRLAAQREQPPAAEEQLDLDG
jgi:hypothetical protein